jgi:hypothetical protein
VAGQPQFLATRPALGPFFDSVFSRCILPIESSTFVLWNGKILRKRGVLLHLPKFSSKALVHPLPCHGSLQCSIHRYRRKEDPTGERGTTRQGHVMCFGRIDKPIEGFRCYKRRSPKEPAHHRQRWPAGWPTPPAGQPWFVVNWSLVMRANHHLRAKVPLYPMSWNAPDSCSFSSSDDREGAPISHAYTSHYRDPHSEEGDHPSSTRGPFE